jgi:hypothetical protein
MAVKDITNGLQAVSAAGAVSGTLDTSSFSGPYTIKVRVPELGAGKRALIAIEDTASATAFSDARPVAVFHVVGPIVPSAEQVFSVQSYEVPFTRYGATNTKLRANVLAVDSSPGLKVHAWLER